MWLKNVVILHYSSNKVQLHKSSIKHWKKWQTSVKKILGLQHLEGLIV